MHTLADLTLAIALILAVGVIVNMLAERITKK